MVGWTHDQWVKRSLACWVDGFIKDEWRRQGHELVMTSGSGSNRD